MRLGAAEDSRDFNDGENFSFPVGGRIRDLLVRLHNPFAGCRGTPTRSCCECRIFLGHADPRMTSKYAHVVDMAKKNPALFIPVKVG